MSGDGAPLCFLLESIAGARTVPMLFVRAVGILLEATLFPALVRRLRPFFQSSDWRPPPLWKKSRDSEPICKPRVWKSLSASFSS